MEKRIIPFIRQKDYVLVGNAGMGAIGEIRLLKDEMIDEVFACKNMPLPLLWMEKIFLNISRRR